MSLPAEVYKEILELQNENVDQRKEKERLENLTKECDKHIAANSKKITDYNYANTLLMELFKTAFAPAHKPAVGIRLEVGAGYLTPGVRDATSRIASHFGYDLKLEGSFYTLTVKKPQVVDERDKVMKALSTPAEEIGRSEFYCPVHPRNCPGECVHTCKKIMHSSNE